MYNAKNTRKDFVELFLNNLVWKIVFSYFDIATLAGIKKNKVLF